MIAASKHLLLNSAIEKRSLFGESRLRFLITGGCGFLGSNLASEVLKRGHELLVFDNLCRTGAEQNLEWLRTLGGHFNFIKASTADAKATREAFANFKPEAVFHLAGQVAMTTSIENPRLDFETNAVGGFNVLEAIRHECPNAAVIFSSTNKVYGDFGHLKFEEKPTRYACPEAPEGFDEFLPLNFQSPYGCSKGAADQYMLDYNRIYGLKTVVFRHSSIFGGRQFSTFDQGWVGWFTLKALEAKSRPTSEPFTIAGNGKQVRDVLFADDLISCYFKALAKIDEIKGQAFNIGGGMTNSISLIELFNFLEAELDVKLKFRETPWRVSDQKIFVANNAKAMRLFGWKPELTKEQGLRKMIAWVRESHGL